MSETPFDHPHIMEGYPVDERERRATDRVLVAHYKKSVAAARRHASAHELVRYFGLTWEAAVAEVAARDGRGRK